MLLTKHQKDIVKELIFLILFGLAVGLVIGSIIDISEAKAEPWDFTIGNDVVIPHGKDRFLTNVFDLGYGDYSIGNEIYTPSHLRQKTLPIGDRPYDGYSYLQKKFKVSNAFGQETELQFRLGAVGKASGAEAIQRYVHDGLGLGPHPEWVGQNPSQPAVDFTYLRRNREYLQSLVGDSRLTTEYGGRFGNVVDEFFLSEELQKHYFLHWYLFAGVKSAAVLYNTHLDGRWFQDDNYTIERTWFVSSPRVGIKFKYDDYYLSYTYKYTTEEFKSQDGRHLYGEISFGKDF